MNKLFEHLIPECVDLLREASPSLIDDPIPEAREIPRLIKNNSRVKFKNPVVPDDFAKKILGKVGLRKTIKVNQISKESPLAEYGAINDFFISPYGGVIFYSNAIVDKENFKGIHDLKGLFPSAEHAAVAAFTWGIEIGVTWEELSDALEDKAFSKEDLPSDAVEKAAKSTKIKGSTEKRIDIDTLPEGILKTRLIYCPEDGKRYDYARMEPDGTLSFVCSHGTYTLSKSTTAIYFKKK